MAMSGSIYTILSLTFPPTDTFVEVSAYEEQETWNKEGIDDQEAGNGETKTTTLA